MSEGLLEEELLEAGDADAATFEFFGGEAGKEDVDTRQRHGNGGFVVVERYVAYLSGFEASCLDEVAEDVATRDFSLRPALI